MPDPASVYSLHFLLLLLALSPPPPALSPLAGPTPPAPPPGGALRPGAVPVPGRNTARVSRELRGRRPRRGRPVRVVPPPCGVVGVLPPPDRARRAGWRRRPGGDRRPGSLGDHEGDLLVEAAAPVRRGGVTGRLLGPRRALLPRASARYPPLLRSKKSLLILHPAAPALAADAGGSAAGAVKGRTARP